MRDLDPVRRPGEFVFVDADDAAGAEAVARDDGGLAVGNLLRGLRC